MNPRKKHNFSSIFFEIFDRYPREYFVFIFFGIFFFALIFETFSYTVLNYSFYNELAEKQQVWESEIPVTRGTIYSATSPTLKSATVLSTSVDLNDIAIDPQVKWDKTKLVEYLTNLVYNEICKLQEREDCYNDLLRFLKVLEISDFEMSESYIKARIFEEVQNRTSKTKMTSVQVRSTLEPQDEKEILIWGIEGVYPSANGLYVNPEELKQRELFAQKYVWLFWGTQEEILHTVRQRDVRFIPIYQKLSLLASDEVQKFIEDESKALSQGVIDEEETIGNFIILSPRAQRIYPERTIGAQILWFIDNAGKWHYGLEWYFDDLLRWNPWEQKWKKDSQWRPIDPITFWEEDVWALEWVDIHTTIDRSIQRKVEQVLERGVTNFRANRGTIVVMDPHTGKVLAMSTYPSFDPNNPGEVYELKKVSYAEYPHPETDLLGRIVFVEDIERGEAYFYDGKMIYLREAERSEYADYSITKYMYKNSFGAASYQNDAIASLYEPGSIMKTMTVAAGIDSGEIQPYDKYNDDGFVKIDTFTLSNVSKECLWYQTFTHALSFSCNVWMIRIVQKIGRALFYKYLLDFWFGEPTGITLSGEISPKIEPYERWPISKLLTTSYGLGISVTPIQMAAAYSVIANGWVYVKPYIVEKITHADGREILFEPQILRRVLKETTAKKVTEMLIDGVVNGVAKGAQIAWYSVAGKTGTAQIAYKGGYENGTASTVWSFIGFAPAEDPQFVIVVKLERPRTDIYGGTTTTKMFAEIAEEILKYYSIPKKETVQ